MMLAQAIPVYGQIQNRSMYHEVPVPLISVPFERCIMPNVVFIYTAFGVSAAPHLAMNLITQCI